MQVILTNIVQSLVLAPIIYLSSVVFTAASFSWMKKIVKESRYQNDWVYIIIILMNGMVLTILDAFENPIWGSIPASFIVAMLPIISIAEFLLISRDTARKYVFFGATFMLLFSCLFGIASAIITTLPVDKSVIDENIIRSAALTLANYLVAVGFIIISFVLRNQAETLKSILNKWSSSSIIYIFMVLNGVTLAFSTSLDYRIYFSDPALNPYRGYAVSGIILRYVLILTTSLLVIYAQCRSENAKTQAKAFKEASQKDSLTGLLNRSGLHERIMEMSIAAEVNKQDFEGALLLMDLDHFKSVNDTLGHPVGDKLLTDVADKLRSLFRDNDLVCRLGGDEFCVFINGSISHDILEQKAIAVKETLRQDFATPNGEIITVTTSIGISHLPDHGPDYDSLYRKADAALYVSKENGRNQYSFAE